MHRYSTELVGEFLDNIYMKPGPWGYDRKWRNHLGRLYECICEMELPPAEAARVRSALLYADEKGMIQLTNREQLEEDNRAEHDTMD